MLNWNHSRWNIKENPHSSTNYINFCILCVKSLKYWIPFIQVKIKASFMWLLIKKSFILKVNQSLQLLSRHFMNPTTRGRRQYDTKLAGKIPTRPSSSCPSHQSYWESVLVMTVIRSPGTKLRSPGCCPVNGWVAVTTREPVAPPPDADEPSSIKNLQMLTSFS